MKPFLSVLCSLALALIAAVLCSIAAVLLMALLYEIFDVCAAFGGPMEGNCGYSFMFFIMPVTVLVCLIAMTIIAYRKVHPWVSVKFGIRPRIEVPRYSKRLP